MRESERVLYCDVYIVLRKKEREQFQGTALLLLLPPYTPNEFYERKERKISKLTTVMFERCNIKKKRDNEKRKNQKRE